MSKHAEDDRCTCDMYPTPHMSAWHEIEAVER